MLEAQLAEKLGDTQAKIDDKNYTNKTSDPAQLKREKETKKQSLKLSEKELAVVKEREEIQYKSTAKLLKEQQQKKDDKHTVPTTINIKKI